MRIASKLAALGAAALCIAMPAAAQAGTTVAPLSVTLSSTAEATAECFPDGTTIDLHNGRGSAAATLVSPPSAVPANPPSFTADTYAAGSPRWVINFSNGKFVTGYPVQLGTFAGVTPTATFTGNQWGVGNGSSYMTWSAVLAAVGNPTAVTSAFIVADSGFAGEFDTVISNGQYNGQPLSCAAASSSPSPSASASPTPSPSHSPFPVGGVQTGGGKPGTSLWLPFGAGLAGLAVLSLAAAMITRRRQRQRS